MEEKKDTFDSVVDVTKTVVVDTIVPASMSYVISTALLQYVLPFTKNPIQKAMAWIGAMSLGYVATTKIDDVVSSVQEAATTIKDACSNMDS